MSFDWKKHAECQFGHPRDGMTGSAPCNADRAEMIAEGEFLQEQLIDLRTHAQMRETQLTEALVSSRQFREFWQEAKAENARLQERVEFYHRNYSMAEADCTELRAENARLQAEVRGLTAQHAGAIRALRDCRDESARLREALEAIQNHCTFDDWQIAEKLARAALEVKP